MMILMAGRITTGDSEGSGAVRNTQEKYMAILPDLVEQPEQPQVG
jgi:hypothetical protein